MKIKNIILSIFLLAGFSLQAQTPPNIPWITTNGPHRIAPQGLLPQMGGIGNAIAPDDITPLRQVQALIAASSGGGGGFASGDTSFTVSAFQGQDQTELLGLINYKITITDPEGITGADFYSKIILTNSGYALDPNGTYYRNVIGQDRLSYFNAEYDVTGDHLLHIKNNTIEIYTLSGVYNINSILTQINALSDPSTLEYLYVGATSGTITIDPDITLLNAVIGANNTITLSSGASFSGIIDPNCNAITFPSGSWSGHIGKVDSDVEIDLDATGLTAIDLRASSGLGIDNFIGIVNIIDGNNSTAILVQSEYNRNYTIYNAIGNPTLTLNNTGNIVFPIQTVPVTSVTLNGFGARIKGRYKTNDDIFIIDIPLTY